MNQPKARITYIVPLCITVALGFLMRGYCFAYFNVFTKIMHAKYVYEDKHVIPSADLFNSLVSGLIPMGAIFGSFIVNPLIVRGRRLSLIVISTTFIIGTLITMVFNMYTLIFGRLIMGACVGAYVAVSPVYISEVCPPSLSGSLGALNQLETMVGIAIAYAISFTVPLSNDEDALTTGIWRLVFIAPASFALLQIILLLFVFKYDTPKFYKKHGAEENYEAIMARLYVLEPEQKEPKQPKIEEKASSPNIVQEEPAIVPPIAVDDPEVGIPPETKQGSSDSSSDKPQSEEVTKDEDTKEPTKTSWPAYYKKALLIACILSAFQQLTGINAVIFFSNEMFTSGKSFIPLSYGTNYP